MSEVLFSESLSNLVGTFMKEALKSAKRGKNSVTINNVAIPIIKSDEFVNQLSTYGFKATCNKNGEITVSW